MKRKLILLITLMLLAINGHAQTDSVPQLKFGYISYEQALQAMPDYKLAQETLSDLRAQYEAEQQRVEQDFNMKYEEFLEGQRDFPQTILRKRQTELKELLERNLAFKNQGRQELAKAETEAMLPIRQRLAEVLAKIAAERGYAFILNTDRDAVPFINPLQGEDVMNILLSAKY